MYRFIRDRSSLLGAALWLVLAGSPVQAADLSLPVTGNLFGSVVDLQGIPQMGASVQLFDRFDDMVGRTTTSGEGRFTFSRLPIDVYSVRVSLPAFLPATRDQIAVKAGLDSRLQIHLANLLSSIDVTYSLPSAGMSDDWKWTLRSSPATRPVTRLLAQDQAGPNDTSVLKPHVFSGTRAMLSLSRGDGGIVDSDGAPGDLGTAFVVSTSILGKNQVQVGGTFGQNSSAGPASLALCAIYTRDSDWGLLSQSPEITMTASQINVGGGQPFSGSSDNPGLPTLAVRTFTLSSYQTIDPVEDVHLEYGVTSESVEYLQHTARISPFARMTVDLHKWGSLISSYSDGDRPDELAAHSQTQDADDRSSGDMSPALDSLARLPQISNRDGRLELQRSQSFEAGYRKQHGKTVVAVTAFTEGVSNGRINVAGDTSAIQSGDLLSDGVSSTLLYNVGSYRRNGIFGTWTDTVGKTVDLTGSYGRMGGFTTAAASGDGISTFTPSMLDHRAHNFANAGVRVRSKRTGTKLLANYGWMDDGAVIPKHYFTTQDATIAPGLNIYARQPLPSLFGMPGHLELTADLRNLLAAGYLPVNTGDGHTLLLVQAPRSIRGGLNFIF